MAAAAAASSRLSRTAVTTDSKKLVAGSKLRRLEVSAALATRLCAAPSSPATTARRRFKRSALARKPRPSTSSTVGGAGRARTGAGRERVGLGRAGRAGGLGRPVGAEETPAGREGSRRAAVRVWTRARARVREEAVKRLTRRPRARRSRRFPRRPATEEPKRRARGRADEARRPRGRRARRMRAPRARRRRGSLHGATACRLALRDARCAARCARTRHSTVRIAPRKERASRTTTTIRARTSTPRTKFVVGNVREYL